MGTDDSGNPAVEGSPISDAEGPVRVTGTFLALGVLAGLFAGASVRDSDVDPIAGVPAP